MLNIDYFFLQLKNLLTDSPTTFFAFSSPRLCWVIEEGDGGRNGNTRVEELSNLAAIEWILG